MITIVHLLAKKIQKGKIYIAFQVNHAWSLNSMYSINLGVHTEACMTDPDSCGKTGGAVSFWLKLPEECINSFILTTDNRRRSQRAFHLRIVCRAIGKPNNERYLNHLR